jgi:hypothetical protein
VTIIWVVGLILNKITFDTLPIFLTISLLFSAYSICIYRINRIIIDPQDKKISILKINLLKGSKTEFIDFEQLQFSFRNEKIGLRSPIINVCKIYQNNKLIASFIPGQDGWSDSKVNELVLELSKAGITRQIDKYNDREVEINGL